MIIAFNLIALLFIVFIIYWLSNAKAVASSDNKAAVVVNNGAYTPSRIKLKAQPTLLLEFIRKSAAEFVVFDGLEVHEKLPLNKSHIIKLENVKPGGYVFTCQMGMYRGELEVAELC